MGIMDEIHKHSQKIVETGKEIEYEISGLRNFLGRSNTTEPSYQPTKPQNSLPLSTSQNPLIAPATQTDLEAMRYEGRIGNWRERFPELKVHKKGNPDKNSWVYKAVDSKTGRNVAIKELTGSFNPDDIQGSRSSEKELESLVGTYSMLHHPGLVQVLGYYWENNGKGIMIPHVVMEFVDGEPISEKIKKKHSPTQEDLLKLLFGLGGVIEYMHTSRSQPVHHRDIKPANIMDVNGDSPYPIRLVDLTESKVGDATMSGSVLGSIGYRPPEQQWGEVNSTTDWYGLFRTLEECIMLENFGKKDLSRVTAPNVPEKLITAIRKGTNLKIDERYGSLIEIARDLGYNISRAPQTREELEAILWHRSSPIQARAEPKPEVQEARGEVAKTRSQNLPAIIDNGDGNVTIGAVKFGDGKNPYETARNIRLVASGKTPKEPFFFAVDDYAGVSHDYGHLLHKPFQSQEEIDQITLAYLQHVSPQHPILAEVLTEGGSRKTLEGIATEEKPRRRDFWKHVSAQGGMRLFPVQDFDKKGYKEAKQGQLQRRKELCDLVGVNEYEVISKGLVTGTIGGFLAGAFGIGALLNFPVPNNILEYLGTGAGTFIGAISGSKIGKYLAKRKLIKRARKLDSMIYQGRVAQGLETRLEDVELSEEEKNKIGKISRNMGIIGGVVTSVGGFLAAHFGNIPLATASLISTPFIYGATYFGTNKYVTNYALRQKRIAEGLPSEMPKQEMMEYLTVKMNVKGSEGYLREVMDKYLGLEKKFFRKKFANKNAEVEYEDVYVSTKSPLGLRLFPLQSEYDHTVLRIRATSKERAEAILDVIKDRHFNIFSSNKTLSSETDPTETKSGGMVSSIGDSN